jgi:hypothetical protein
VGMLTRGQKGKTGQKSSGKPRKRATDGRIGVSFLSRFKPHRNHETYCSRRLTADTSILGWVGLEPTTNALKGRCSTIELPTRQKGREQYNRYLSLQALFLRRKTKKAMLLERVTMGQLRATGPQDTFQFSEALGIGSGLESHPTRFRVFQLFFARFTESIPIQRGRARVAVQARQTKNLGQSLRRFHVAFPASPPAPRIRLCS